MFGWTAFFSLMFLSEDGLNDWTELGAILLYAGVFQAVFMSPGILVYALWHCLVDASRLRWRTAWLWGVLTGPSISTAGMLVLGAWDEPVSILYLACPALIVSLTTFLVGTWLQKRSRWLQTTSLQSVA